MKVRLNGVGVHGGPSRLIVVKHHLYDCCPAQLRWSWPPEMGALKLVPRTDFLPLNSKFIWAHSVRVHFSSREHSTFLFFFFFNIFRAPFLLITASLWNQPAVWLGCQTNMCAQTAHAQAHISALNVPSRDYLSGSSWLSSSFCAPRWQSERPTCLHRHSSRPLGALAA